MTATESREIAYNKRCKGHFTDIDFEGVIKLVRKASERGQMRILLPHCPSFDVIERLRFNGYTVVLLHKDEPVINRHLEPEIPVGWEVFWEDCLVQDGNFIYEPYK